MARLAHALVFTSDLERMVAFYAGVFGLRREETADAGFVLMKAEHGAAVALHQMPPHVAADIQLSSPPQWREDVAIKLCFEVEDLEARRTAILDHGGQAKAPWSWAGIEHCECTNPEGNVIQIFGRGPSTS